MLVLTRLACPRLIGVDFTSTPSKKKPITVAHGHLLSSGAVELSHLEIIPTWQGFEQLLASPDPWIGGFDFPFGLPRELVVHLGWPTQWCELVKQVAAMPRSHLRELFKEFCDSRPVGNKFAHRATDIPAGSSPSMKWVNPPVAYMFHEGAPRLLDAKVVVPGLYEGSNKKSIALEAYPGYVARSVTKASYKSDDKAKQTAEREFRRTMIVAALAKGQHALGVPLKLTKQQAKCLVAEPGADLLDAVICLIQAAWAAKQAVERPNLAQHDPQRYGLPKATDSLEGWIIGV